VNASGTGDAPPTAAGTTATGTGPVGCAGNVHSMNPELWKMTADAETDPTVTPCMLDGVAPNERPYTETTYPPAVDPVDGTSDVTVGAMATGSK
jgi:hypothetical protein